jgi:hypothetical protein
MQPSVTRVLVIIVTLYLLVVRSEGQVEIQYTVWARSMLLIGLLHLILARNAAERVSGSVGTIRNSIIAANGAEAGRFPNLMR